MYCDLEKRAEHSLLFSGKNKALFTIVSKFLTATREKNYGESVSQLAELLRITGKIRAIENVFKQSQPNNLPDVLWGGVEFGMETGNAIFTHPMICIIVVGGAKCKASETAYILQISKKNKITKEMFLSIFK